MYSVFVEDVKDNNELSTVGAEVDKSNSADFNEVLVSLRRKGKGIRKRKCLYHFALF